jgi:hypothetical protein
MATNKEFLIPGVGFVNVPDAGEKEYMIPGGGFICEDTASGSGGGGGEATYGGFFFANG